MIWQWIWLLMPPPDWGYCISFWILKHKFSIFLHHHSMRRVNLLEFQQFPYTSKQFFSEIWASEVGIFPAVNGHRFVHWWSDISPRSRYDKPLFSGNWVDNFEFLGNSKVDAELFPIWNFLSACWKNISCWPGQQPWKGHLTALASYSKSPVFCTGLGLDGLAGLSNSSPIYILPSRTFCISFRKWWVGRTCLCSRIRHIFRRPEMIQSTVVRNGRKRVSFLL